jgi:WD40-like Beta Propeller Repeat
VIWIIVLNRILHQIDMMRTPTATLWTLLLIAGPLGAQQPMGVVSHAVASPVLPDIVAFERAVNDRQELQFVRLSNQRVFLATRTPMTGLPGVVVTLPGAGKTLSAFAGQLDWRPVAEQGRSWFAYVASDEIGHLGLLLNYIDAAGELATTDPIRIPFAGQVRTPRWSRDGRHLAFVSDSSILYIVPDVIGALRSGTARNLRPTRVAAASRPALFPAWSPSGDHIAYGTEVVSEGNRNGAIEVLPINQPTGEVTGVPVVVTGELTGNDEYRPTWSRDGKYIAFYADSAGTGSARQPVSIGIVEVVLNPRTGNTYRGIVKEGSQRWLADDVIPDDMRGPAWTSIAEGSQRKDALLYVQRDAARNDPMVVADFQRYLAQLPRVQYETAMPSASDAVGARSVSSVEMNKRMRFVFTSVKGGSETVSYRDVVATWAQGPEPAPVVVAAAAPAARGPAPKPDGAIGIPSHKGQNVTRALLFPGLGQFSAGQRAKGTVLAVVGAAGAVVGIIGKLSMGAPLADGQLVVDNVNRDPSTLPVFKASYDRAKADFEAQRGKALLGGFVFAATWLYGIVDASVASAPEPNVSLIVVPDRNGGGGSSANVGFSVAVGHLASGW